MVRDDDYPILLSIQQAARKTGKSEKTIRRWIHDGKLAATKHGAGGYLIKREDVEAVTKHVTKEWHEQTKFANLDLRVLLLEGQVEQLKYVIAEQERVIEDLQKQVTKLQPKKPATKRKTSTTRPKTTRRKKDEEWG